MVDRVEKTNANLYRVDEARDSTDDQSGNQTEGGDEAESDNFEKLANKTDWKVLFDKNSLWKRNVEIKVEDIDKAWTAVGKKVGVNAQILREKMEPLSGIYSVAEHARTLLFALNDGALPSNVGGGYNLRILLRRALSFIERYDWKIHLPDVCVWHAEELKPLFPELSGHLDDVRKILEVEMAKFASTKQMAKQVVEKLLSDQVKIDTELLLELYDSKGISPNIIKDAASAMGKEIHVPDNFYSLVAERQEKRHQVQVEEKEQREALDLTGVVETKALYYDDWLKKDFEGKVAKVIGKHVVLESTYFYPTSGGQEYDTGTMDGIKVVNVFKQGPYIVQLLEKEAPFKVGQKVKCTIDWHRRFQLAQHHTGTHVLNAAARRVLGLERLTEHVGECLELGDAAAIPLPHPSGASGWLNLPQNRERLERALARVRGELRRLA